MMIIDVATHSKSFIGSRLSRQFFHQSTLKVAENLLGKLLVFQNTIGVITETEAYMGFDDPASHAYRGKTKRTELMFGEAGFSYVYLIYGMYHCLNIVTEKKDYPAAVLIRGLKILHPIDSQKNIFLDGPGKLCRYLGITKNHNGLDIINSNSELYIAKPRKLIKLPYLRTPRIGIKVGQDKLWRFLAT